MMKITVVGTGYIGLSLAVLLFQDNTVYVVDIDPHKIKLINDRKFPIVDDDIAQFLSKKT